MSPIEPVGPAISTRLTAELLADVDREAQACGQSRAEVIRDLLGEALAARRRRKSRPRPAGRKDEAS